MATMNENTVEASRAIHTRWLGPTDTKGSRIKAASVGSGRSVTVPRDYALSGVAYHAVAVRALCERLGWGGAWFAGESADGRGYSFVCADWTGSLRFPAVKWTE